VQRLKRQARTLKRETHALYFAARDPRTPWLARIVVAAVVAYALSPFDLIPDFIPVIGYLDDLLIVPLGLKLALKLVPPEVMAEARERAVRAEGHPISRVGAAFIIAVWLLAAVLVFVLVRDLLYWSSNAP
jgi:uncharacterized membrane protein YkvA (DUF1232 family)